MPTIEKIQNEAKKPLALHYSLRVNSYFLFFSFLTRITLCSSLNPKFQACKPRSCGNLQNISYPFYIEGRQEAFCGFPGFALSCIDNGFPVLNIFENRFIVHQIFYNNQSIRVSDAGLNTTGCLRRTNNLTNYESRFRLAPNQKELFLVFGCNLAPSSLLTEYRIGCSAENETDSVLAMYGDEDEDLSLASKNCNGGVVKANVEDGYGEKGRIREGLRRGFVLSWTASDCSLCTKTGGQCGFDFDREVYSFRCYCPDRDDAWNCDPEDNRRLSKASMIGLAIGCGAVIMISLFIILLLKQERYNCSGFLNQSRNIYFDIKSSTSPECIAANFRVPIFSYEELEKVTNNFDPLRELGNGGFGTVYYGKLQDGREVAVKRLYERKRDNKHVKQFMNEIQILTHLRHRNLVSLYGCTSHHSRGLLLAYEYISNGTVASHLHGDLAKSGSLPWPLRMKIAIEIASALTYLHASNIIHRDVKTNNILLDNNFCAKVADFGISRLSSNDVSHVLTAPQGTLGYVDPEYRKSYKLTDKSDVYSFGVVLIELISSMPAVDCTRNIDEINLANLAIKKIQTRKFTELVDLSLSYESNNEFKRMIISVAELAFQCLQRDTELRPSMHKVLEALQKIECGKDETKHLDIHNAEISQGYTYKSTNLSGLG